MKTIIRVMILALLLSPVSVFAGRGKVLVTAKDLKKMMDNKTANLVVIEAGWGGPKSVYDKGHIPGSIHVNTDEIEYDLFKKREGTDPKKLGRSTTVDQDLAKGLTEKDTLPKNWWNIYPDKFLLPAIANMGVDINSKVVIYSKDASAGPRLAWTMIYAGVKDVKILDGGLNSWKKEGFEVVTKRTERKPKKRFGARNALHPEYLVDIAFVRKAIENPSVAICDIRTKGEYDGTSAPYSYIPTKGRIKNAKWGMAGDKLSSMDAYINSDGTFKRLSEVEAMWKKNGITKDKHAVFYCGTAWRSSLAFLYAYMMDWENISNFDSSWFEWSMGPEKDKNPVIK